MQQRHPRSIAMGVRGFGRCRREWKAKAVPKISRISPDNLKVVEDPPSHGWTFQKSVEYAQVRSGG